MLRFTKRVDYGLMAIQYVAFHEGVSPVAVKQIAEEFNIPTELLAKILQRLAKRGLIVSQNGPKGGYRLAHQPGGDKGRREVRVTEEQSDEEDCDDD